MRPEEGSDKLPDWKSPYTRTMIVFANLNVADKIIWYAYRYPKYFLRHLDFSEDILHEIIIKIKEIPPSKRYGLALTRVARNTVARFIAKVGMTLSGYTNFRSWLHRRTFLSVRDGVDKREVVTELELAIQEIERAWNQHPEPNDPAKLVAIKYPTVMAYAESGMSMRDFCKKHKITKYSLGKQLDDAREYYIKMVALCSLLK